jgi:magnesium-transporting ATPase (P-type)
MTDRDPPHPAAQANVEGVRSPVCQSADLHSVVAAIISFAMGHASDAVVILVVVLINAVIGALQEGRAERSMEALRKLSALRVRVVRDGHERSRST